MGNHDLWKCFTKEQLADFLLSLRLLEHTGWPPEKQLACLYALSNHSERHYSSFSIQKRDGTTRNLLAPDPLLKKIQQNILHHVLEGLTISPRATAYHRGADILQNASGHKGQKVVLKMDITDFFGSITFPLVCRSAFPRSHFPPEVAVLLTHLCCYRDYLPQGAPTSAAISNLVLKPFDDYIDKWCRERNIVYTRYCDDMAFSGDFDTKPVVNKVRNFLYSMGFEINERKTRIMSRHQRQLVTGLVVNEKPQPSREYRVKLRQEIYYCRKHGVASHLARMNDSRYLPPGPEQAEWYLRSLLGKVDFVLHTDPHNQYFKQARAALQKMLADCAGVKRD